MMEFIGSNMAPIMFGSLILFLLFGYSVAFSLAACGLFFGLVGIEMGLLPEALMQALPLRIFGIMQNDTLLAIPFFTFMGLILERSGMAEDLLETVGQMFGPVRGGLAYAVVFVGALLAATTGVVVGVMLALVGGRFVSSMLFNVAPGDPVVLGGASVALLVSAIAASMVPAVRASKVDPTIALRAE